jgi:recombinational DNA repair protein (RecF pathway)
MFDLKNRKDKCVVCESPLKATDTRYRKHGNYCLACIKKVSDKIESKKKEYYKKHYREHLILNTRTGQEGDRDRNTREGSRQSNKKVVGANQELG